MYNLNGDSFRGFTFAFAGTADLLPLGFLLEISRGRLRTNSFCCLFGSLLLFAIRGDSFSRIPPCFPPLGFTLIVRLQGTHFSPVGGLLFFSFLGELHYSGGVVHNGMYARHKTYEHDAWRKDFDEKKANGKTSKANPSATSNTAQNADAKVLALSESLRTAVCTQAGLSSEVADRLWSNACRELVNE